MRELMDSYLAGELLVETNHELLRHIESCAECAADLGRRQTLRALLRQPPAMHLDVAPLRRRIDAAISRDRLRWWREPRWRWSAAAILVGAIVFFGWPRAQVDAAVFQDAVRNHVECALTRPKTMTYDPQRTARRLKAPFTPLAAAVTAQVGGYTLIDAHTCPYKGRQYAHLVFRDGDRALSVFVDPGRGGPLPAGDAGANLGTSGLAFRAARVDGFEAMAMATRAHEIVFVSDLPRAGHLDVVRQLAPAVALFVGSLER
jgi:anti-sigma factor RsiW